MRSYQNRNFKNFKEFLADVPNNTDRKNMKKELGPLIDELLKNNVESPRDFVDIMMRFNLSRQIITEFIKKLISLNLVEISLSNRIVKQTNAFEKNTIFTYYSLVAKTEMMNEFKGFVTEKFPYFRNKDSLFNSIEKEINNIKGSNSNDDNSNDNSNPDYSTDLAGSPLSDHFQIQDGEGEEYLGGFDMDFAEPDDDDIFGINFVEYI